MKLLRIKDWLIKLPEATIQYSAARVPEKRRLIKEKIFKKDFQEWIRLELG